LAAGTNKGLHHISTNLIFCAGETEKDEHPSAMHSALGWCNFGVKLAIIWENEHF
jgi:hypothetical protein